MRPLLEEMEGIEKCYDSNRDVAWDTWTAFLSLMVGNRFEIGRDDVAAGSVLNENRYLSFYFKDVVELVGQIWKTFPAPPGTWMAHDLPDWYIKPKVERLMNFLEATIAESLQHVDKMDEAFMDMYVMKNATIDPNRPGKLLHQEWMGLMESVTEPIRTLYKEWYK